MQDIVSGAEEAAAGRKTVEQALDAAAKQINDLLG